MAAKNLIRLIITGYLLILQSCFFWDNEFMQIDDAYKVGYVNTYKSRDIHYHSQGIITGNQYVVAADWNADYIVAKTKESDREAFHFYIIDKKLYASNSTLDQDKNPGRIGPLNETEFGIEKLNYGFTGDFSLIYAD